MKVLTEIINNLLLEQDSKLSIIRKSIGERIPISIYYRGPEDEVREGQRIDIEPIVLGKHAKSGNLVIWAYVFKGVSKKGIPNWKMFRVDRIVSAKYNKNGVNFKLGSLPGYEKGKAPVNMKSLSSVEVFSPYWFEDDKRFTAQPTTLPTQKPKAPETKVEPTVPPSIVKPEVSTKNLSGKVYNELRSKIKDVNGQKIVSTKDYNDALNSLYSYKEGEFKTYQRQIGGNLRPGEGTRKRFTDTSKSELDKELTKNNIKVSDDNGNLQEANRIQSRIKRLINW